MKKKRKETESGSMVWPSNHLGWAQVELGPTNRRLFYSLCAHAGNVSVKILAMSFE